VAKRGLSDIDWTHPAFAAISALGCEVTMATDAIRAINARCDRERRSNAAGHPLRLVAAIEAPRGVPYESHIAATGRIPTRDNRHDFLNALIWLAFPRTKARLNALHAAVIARDGITSARGALRHAATLLDENGVVMVTPDAQLVAALRQHRWREAFVELRGAWANVRVWVFGHALMERLASPYKSITGHAVHLALPAIATLDEVDCVLQERLDARLAPSAFFPLPMLGIPGWTAASEQQDYYDDISVFRPARAAAPSP
jgi:Protein of unknown function (DUF3025)